MTAPFLHRVRLDIDPALTPPQPYALRLPVIQQLMVEPWILDCAVTIITGENGTGKSTLLEGVASALRFHSKGGDRDEVGRSDPTEDSARLGRHCRLRMPRSPLHGAYLRSESHELSQGLPLLSERSHGESVSEVIDSFSRGGGIMLLDEPEAGVSPTRQMALLVMISEAARRGTQAIIVTHSPILTAIPGASVWECTEQGLHRTSWRRSAPFQAMAEFMADPEGTIRFLIDGEE